MKKTYLMLFALCLVLSSCIQTHRNNVSVRLKENEETYELNARFNPNKTKRVQRYIQNQVEPNMIFTSMGSTVNATAILEDDTKFYIESTEGALRIKLNKNENSEASYYRVKDICEGVKDIVVH